MPAPAPRSIRPRRKLLATTACALAASTALAKPAHASDDLARLPVREVTVFKDGHALVVRHGELPTDARGDVVLDELPVPVLGTFWPYASSAGPKLLSVTASRRRVAVERTALDLREFIEANAGAEVRLTDTQGVVWNGRLGAIPVRSAEELERTGTPGPGPRLPVGGSVVLIELERATQVVPLEQVRNVSIHGAIVRRLPLEELRSRLVLDLDSGSSGRPERAQVGMMYLQKGLRWVPSYKLTIDGKGRAEVELQATLVNDLADLEDVTLNLVVGVPSFAFKDTPDPIALQESLAALGPQFAAAGSATGYALSNALMTQVASPLSRVGMAADSETSGGAAAEPGPELAGAEKEHDLYLFTIRHVTLARGERMVLPVVRETLDYRDVYTLEVTVGPPPEIRAMSGEPHNPELQRLLATPRAMHALRIKNRGQHPLTTAPALVVSGERVLAQGLLTYTPRGAEVDLPLLPAVDIKVRRKDLELGRTPSALMVGSTSYARVDLRGTITLESHAESAVEIEVVRRVLGHVGKADTGGKAEMRSSFEEDGATPPWWRWYGWPGWWHNVNGAGHFAWTVRLEPGKSVALGANWHYFWP